MLKKFLFLSLFLIPAALFASDPIPQPNCFVEGVIEEISFEPAHKEECFNNNTCATDNPLSFPDRYALKIMIESSEYDSGEAEGLTCAELYPAGEVRQIYITKGRVRDIDELTVGKIIKGKVSSFFYTKFDNHELYDVREINNDQIPPNPEIKEISTNNKLTGLFILAILAVISILIFLKNKQNQNGQS